MGSTLLFILTVIVSAILLSVGIIFTHDGYKKDSNGKRNTTFIVVGWTILGIVSAAATFATVYVVWEYRSGILIVLLFLSPIIIFGGLVGSLVSGITNLIKGYSTKTRSAIIGGYVAIGVFVTIILSIIILIVWFSNYLNTHPISLM